MVNYDLIQETIQLVAQFEAANGGYSQDIHGFRQWVADGQICHERAQPTWDGKADGRSPEAAISTLLVHMNRYAKNYARSAIYDSDFSTQEDFIYLINLKAFGAMSKMALIKRNIQEKPVGMQIISRLQSKGWVAQHDSTEDRRSKVIHITEAGLAALDAQMDNIRKATMVVSGGLTEGEKMDLIRILQKLEKFHRPIYDRQADVATLLDYAEQQRVAYIQHL